MATQAATASTTDAKKEASKASEQTYISDPTARVAKAEQIIRRNVFWALGAGVVPIALFDIAAVTSVQMKMIKELSDVYGLKFSSGIAKKIVYSLLSSAGVVGVGAIIGGSLAKLIPVVGTTLGFVSVPVLSGAFTHGLGQVLIMHFESGGTLLDFDAAAMRSHFKQEFEKAKEVVSQMHSSDRANTKQS